MVEMKVVYEGELRTRVTHGPSGTAIETDAPVDNQGRGERLSPTDMVAAALGACTLTVMGIAARRKGLALEGATARVEKHMVSEPVRRIGRLVVSFTLPASLAPADRTILERVFEQCPVRRSIHPDIAVEATFTYR